MFCFKKRTSFFRSLHPFTFQLHIFWFLTSQTQENKHEKKTSDQIGSNSIVSEAKNTETHTWNSHIILYTILCRFWPTRMKYQFELGSCRVPNQKHRTWERKKKRGKRDAHSAKSKHELFHIMYARYAISGAVCAPAKHTEKERESSKREIERTGLQLSAPRTPSRCDQVVYNIKIHISSERSFYFAILCVNILLSSLKERETHTHRLLRFNEKKARRHKKSMCNTLVIMQRRFHDIYFLIFRSYDRGG